MEKWEIRATPSADDPERHVLLLHGGPADVAALLKVFGALMGRPEPAQVEGFNLRLVLHKLKPGVRAKLDAWLRKVAPAAAPEEPAKTKDQPLPPLSAPTMPAFAPAPTPAMPALAPPPPPVLDIPSVPPPAEKPALVSLSPEPALPPVPVPEPTSAGAPAPEAAPVAASAPAPAPASVPPPTAAAEYPLTVQLSAEWTMETLLVGAYNRFAHAAVMSVVTSPGTMYNPLFLYGVPGTGKSHMLNAIGGALSKGLGGSVLLSTSGSRLSRAVNTALARNSMAEIDARIAGSKALLIDDIHLMALSDQNKDALARIFKAFFDRKAQVVITSLYSPRSLGALEEALKFSFSKGWSVDLKIPSPTTQKEIVGAAADRVGSGLGTDEISLLHEKLSQSGYSDLTLWLKRAMVFKRIRDAAGQPSTLQAILNLIYEPVQASVTDAAKPAAFASSFQPPPAPPRAEPIGVIVPKGQDGLGAFTTAMFYDIGPKNGFPQIYRHALWETYDPAVPFGVPFMIGEMCHRAGVTRALIVGPPPESPLGPRSAELAHATRRILESFGVQMAWIPYNGIQLAAHYLNAHLDLVRAAPVS